MPLREHGFSHGAVQILPRVPGKGTVSNILFNASLPFSSDKRDI
ncbi:hypothetical protein ES703_46126 [subsurface metagenome]